MNKTSENLELKLREKIFIGSSVVFNLAVSGVYITSKIDSSASLIYLDRIY